MNPYEELKAAGSVQNFLRAQYGSQEALDRRTNEAMAYLQSVRQPEVAEVYAGPVGYANSALQETYPAQQASVNEGLVRAAMDDRSRVPVVAHSDAPSFYDAVSDLVSVQQSPPTPTARLLAKNGLMNEGDKQTAAVSRYMQATTQDNMLQHEMTHASQRPLIQSESAAQFHNRAALGMQEGWIPHDLELAEMAGYGAQLQRYLSRSQQPTLKTQPEAQAYLQQHVDEPNPAKFDQKIQALPPDVQRLMRSVRRYREGNPELYRRILRVASSYLPALVQQTDAGDPAA